MTEAEWLISEDPQSMLEHVEPTQRQLRLLALQCCRLIQSNDPLWLQCLQFVEDQINWGIVPDNAFEFYHSQAQDRVTRQHQLWHTHDPDRVNFEPYGHDWQMWEAAAMLTREGFGKSEANDVIVQSCCFEPDSKAWLEGMIERARVMREILPFHPITLSSSYLTSTVLALAQGIYEEKAFDRMPILADALQDAGCDNSDILNHCRGPGPHVRGCFVVDLCLGKKVVRAA
jgi:hypothetical protein